MDERAFASATGLAGEIRDRRVGCLELLDFFLERAERYNPALNAVVAWQVEPARERARAADAALARGEVWGPLHGLPMTVKNRSTSPGCRAPGATRRGKTRSPPTTRCWSTGCWRPAR